MLINLVIRGSRVMSTDEMVSYVVLGVLAAFLISGLWFVVIKGLTG
jgi:hypothetical protein